MKKDVALAETQLKFAQCLSNKDQFDQFFPLLSNLTEQQAQIRIAYYRGTQYANQKNALANAYPVLLQLVGEEFFEQMAREYSLAYPSQSGDLNQFGVSLPEFLKIKETDYLYFEGVAALEWEVHSAYYAKDAPELTWNEVVEQLQLGTVELDQLRFNPHPSAYLFQSDFACVQVWFAHQGGEVQALEVDIATPSFALVHRLVWNVVVTPLSCAEWHALQALFNGEPLSASLEKALIFDAQFDIAKYVPHWFSLGTFTSIRSNHLPIIENREA